MAFKLEAFQNRHLNPGQARVDAIVSVTAGATVSAASRPLVVGFIIDRSGSMRDEGRLEAVKGAVERALELLDERAQCFVVAFDQEAEAVVPLMQMTAANRGRAVRAVHALQPAGGTAMSCGLHAARQLFLGAPDAVRQGIFLTDGKNESEAKGQVTRELAACAGLFECNCWGVGTDWHVGEVQEIAQALLGKASLIPEPAGVDAAFRAAMEQAASKALKDVRLRLWTPQGADVVFVKQVNPTIEELTHKARQVGTQVREYLTGAWAAGEVRDFHFAVQVRAGQVGDEMLAARPSVVYLEPEAAGWAEREEKPPEARIFASWTDDSTLSSRIDGHVAHYTGQRELADAIQEGLKAREVGNEAAATQLLGRAVKLAHESQNQDMTQRLKKVVEVLDAPTGTVKLRKDVRKAAAMDLQLESHTTKRASRSKAP
jgi:hypothetical protein